MDEGQFQELIRRLDAIIRLMTLDVMADKPTTEQVSLLSSAGFQPKEIAHILGKTPGAVSQALYRQRRQGKGTAEGEGNRT